jgi:hypothetical protein
MFSVAPASFGASTLANLSGAGGLATGAGGFGAAGLGAALGPIGWAGLGMQAVSTIGSLFGGQKAAEEAEKQMKENRQYQVGAGLAGQIFPRFLDYQDTKREIALANSPAFKSADSFSARQDTFDRFAGKYGPALARLGAGSFYG